MRLRTAFLPLLLLASTVSQAQPDQRPLVQFSGVVVTDSLAPVPWATIMIKDSFRGTISDVFGYFSLVAQEGDTLQFSALGYQRSQYVVPDSLTQSRYSMIHVMIRDTVMLETVKVYPWPSKEQFRDAFLNLRLPDDDFQLTMRNLSAAEMMQRMENLTPDAIETFQNQMALDQTKLYYSGGTPPINLFNPVAWAQFISAWRRGDYKKKDEVGGWRPASRREGGG